MQSTCLFKVLVIGCLQSHKISIVYQLFSSNLTLYKDFSCYFYFPTCYSESFPVLFSRTFFSLIHNFYFICPPSFLLTPHVAPYLFLFTLSPKTCIFFSEFFISPFSHYYKHIFSFLHPFLEVLISSDFTALWEYTICL